MFVGKLQLFDSFNFYPKTQLDSDIFGRYVIHDKYYDIYTRTLAGN